MTSKGPSQPKAFYDSMILCAVDLRTTCWDMFSQAGAPGNHAFPASHD